MNYSDATDTVLYGHAIMPAELWNIEIENFRNSSLNFKLQYHYIFQHNSKTKTKVLKVYQKNLLQFCHKNSDRPMFQQKIYIIVGCSDCSLLLNVYQHPVLRLVMSNERYPLILHVILTCRRNLYNHILIFVFK